MPSYASIYPCVDTRSIQMSHDLFQAVPGWDVRPEPQLEHLLLLLVEGGLTAVPIFWCHIWTPNWLVMLTAMDVHRRKRGFLCLLLTKSQRFPANMGHQQQLRPSTARSQGTPWRLQKCSKYTVHKCVLTSQ